MRRMKIRFETRQRLYYCVPWSIIFAKNQWKYINHIIQSHPFAWVRRMAKFNLNSHDDINSDFLSYRIRGRPRIRWDDHVAQFCKSRWPENSNVHWIDILENIAMADFENEFVKFVTDYEITD